ncbi:MAG: hypothetical protein AAGG68_26290 [Bacteroidota bacterium]
MNKFLYFAIVILTLSISSCSTSQVIVPLSESAVIEDTYTIIWNGSSEAYRYVDGNWQRDASYDYVFDVVQKRYGKTWKSTKSLHRLHPDYDGKAGERSQAMYFELDYELKGDQLACTLQSSLGSGQGKSDREFRKQTLEFAAEDVSSLAPYNWFRITQNYDYEAGVLTETVELFKLKDGKEIPFMKNEEKAFFYVKGRLEDAPTKL